MHNIRSPITSERVRIIELMSNGSRTGCIEESRSYRTLTLILVGKKLHDNILDYYGRIVGCKSGCLAYNNDQECCRGEFGTPDRCRQSKTAQIFKDACPTSYSYAYDDGTSTFTCKNANYIVQFC
ncbi:unnamed protein product [Caenorhabditis nigoni]